MISPRDGEVWTEGGWSGSGTDTVGQCGGIVGWGIQDCQRNEAESSMHVVNKEKEADRERW